MHDTQLEFAKGEIIAVKGPSPAWCHVRLKNGRVVEAIDPHLSSRLESPMKCGDRVVIIDEGDGRFYLIVDNEDLEQREPGYSTEHLMKLDDIPKPVLPLPG